MSEPGIEQTVQRGRYRIEIDGWGGCHFFLPGDSEDPSASFSPDFMDEIVAAREQVVDDE